MVCSREASLAGRALAVLEALICRQRDYDADLCANLRPALLQALKMLSVNMGQELGQGHTAQGRIHKHTSYKYITIKAIHEASPEKTF